MLSIIIISISKNKAVPCKSDEYCQFVPAAFRQTLRQIQRY